MLRVLFGGGAVVLAVVGFYVVAQASPDYWKYEWPRTDFTKSAVDFEDILSGGPPKDGIPSIDNPIFVTVAEAKGLADTEPVVGLVIGKEARAYPLQILMWHEIVNDVVAGVPVAVTFCPLCNAAVVFDRRLDGQVLEFGTTGKLRNSDLVMYDRQSESWWQQFTGEAIVGELLGKKLTFVPSRLESFANFKKRAPDGKVQVPNSPGMRRYGANPYAGYDSSTRPFLYRGQMPANVPPLSRVVSIDGRAWSLSLLREKRRIETADGLIITWEPGQNSALDARTIDAGTDVGNVVAQRKTASGLEDVVYGVDFAFAFHAFYPDAEIATK
ncbi:MAG: DUF3179 domain-containing protein [Alphaproteobacteria bacterium]|jgi:hypothetical protein|nr:DUF3179 domain-containing protein [Alphaproteobacteria bacterium]